ncbi:ADP-ribosyl-[dinitrogen reductase] hydrolase [Varunaivibrio sulfuroxidans]|uniref:ADP-ribosyl-[dinitrogen reductase] hydrolase n=1 Tax=Varunaivibrio sulfuroxidans TaxID=1773489 RepID=A0A4R3J8C1_9PROT|nr:ADP-ribosyl-[dinitrogen reductase] hydrolase [Varunaivibrio sulfuroxidans]TCS61737.1 ADP-ribosyl-[dinitrogen reductase] hydrolase [Varunaivibrio sulfuroxidans]WES32078.1 ADP-ribosyl-[dinitrogen reductase] hydrolase [Varunaivibrio sulfuroxidans]
MTARARLIERASGAFLGLAVGDALGATVEFMTPREIRAEHGWLHDIKGGGWLRLKPGEVTDDTEMALALGRSLIARGGNFDPAHAAQEFSDWMRGKPKDIGHTVRRGIVRFRTTGEIAVPVNEHDAGNGACMRIAPLALATFGGAPEAVAVAVFASAHLTHNCVLSDEGTLAVVRMIHAGLASGGDPGGVGDIAPIAHDLAARFSSFAFRGKRRENPSGYLPETLQAVFQALLRTDSFESALADVVNRGGDADTTGAIAGTVAGAVYGAGDIPKRWLKRLDPAVRRACADQARRLVALSPGYPRS